MGPEGPSFVPEDVATEVQLTEQTPAQETVQEISPENRGRSFIARAKEFSRDLCKATFRIDDDKMNAVIKTASTACMGVCSAAALHVPYDSMASKDPGSVYGMLGIVGAMGAGAMTLAISRSYEEMMRRRESGQPKASETLNGGANA